MHFPSELVSVIVIIRVRASVYSWPAPPGILLLKNPRKHITTAAAADVSLRTGVNRIFDKIMNQPQQIAAVKVCGANPITRGRLYLVYSVTFLPFCFGCSCCYCCCGCRTCNLPCVICTRPTDFRAEYKLFVRGACTYLYENQIHKYIIHAFFNFTIWGAVFFRGRVPSLCYMPMHQACTHHVSTRPVYW